MAHSFWNPASSPFGAATPVSSLFGGATPPSLFTAAAPASSPFGAAAPFPSGATTSLPPFGAASHPSPFGPSFPPGFQPAAPTPFGGCPQPPFGAPSQHSFGGNSSNSSSFATCPQPISKAATFWPFGNAPKSFDGFAGSGSGMFSTPATSGIAATTSGFGGSTFASTGGFGGSPFGSTGGFVGVSEGTRARSYVPTEEESESAVRGCRCLMMSLSAMGTYKEKSHEELRYEDYKQQGNGGLFAPVSNPTQSSLFGSRPCAKGPSELHKAKSTDPSSSGREDIAACNCASKQPSSVAPTATAAQGSCLNLNGQSFHLFGASTGAATHVPLYVNCLIPVFGSFGLNGGGVGQPAVSSSIADLNSRNAVYCVPAFIPIATPLCNPHHPCVSQATEALPKPSSGKETSPSTSSGAAFQFPTTNSNVVHGRHLFGYPSSQVPSFDNGTKHTPSGASGEQIKSPFFPGHAGAPSSSNPFGSSAPPAFGFNSFTVSGLQSVGSSGEQSKPCFPSSSSTFRPTGSASGDFSGGSSFSFNPVPQHSPTTIPKGLELIVEKLGVNPWKNDSKKATSISQILPCEDACNDADIIDLAGFAVDQHNAMANEGDEKVDFRRVVAACLEAVDGGRYHIVLEAVTSSLSSAFTKRFYVVVLRKKTDRPNNLTVLEKWWPGTMDKSTGIFFNDVNKLSPSCNLLF